MNYQISRANNGWILTYENPETSGKLKEVFVDEEDADADVMLQSLIALFKFVVYIAGLRPNKHGTKKLVIEIQEEKE